MTTANVRPPGPTDQARATAGVQVPERLYIATPKAAYHTDRLQQAVTLLRARFPDAALLLPWELFASRADWLARFPAILESMTQLILLTDGEGYIGRGVADECGAALQVGKPVHLLTDAGELIPYARLRLSRPNENDWVRYRCVGIRPTAE